MSKSAQLWTGKRMQSYLQALFRAEPGVDDALAERLAIRANRAINRMLVWDATPPPPADQPAPSKPSKAKAGKKPRVKSKAKSSKALTPSPDGFDPYAFSAMVVYAKKGAPALMEKLKAIDDPSQLKELATAQHIGLKGPLNTVEQLRTAIVKGAKQRLADRRAAAS